MKRNSHLINHDRSDKRERMIPGNMQGNRHGNEIDPGFMAGRRLPLIEDRKEKRFRD